MKTLTSAPERGTPYTFTAASLHTITQRWLSALRFNMDEIQFLNKLLASYLFEPKSPDDFQKVRNFQLKLAGVIKDFTGLAMDISCQQNALGGTLECQEQNPGKSLEQAQLILEARFNCLAEEYAALKLAIFEHAGTTLKKAKNQE